MALADAVWGDAEATPRAWWLDADDRTFAEAQTTVHGALGGEFDYAGARAEATLLADQAREVLDHHLMYYRGTSTTSQEEEEEDDDDDEGDEGDEAVVPGREGLGQGQGLGPDERGDRGLVRFRRRVRREIRSVSQSVSTTTTTTTPSQG